MDITLEEKANYAARRAVILEAQKHFYDLTEPFFPLGFSVSYRNPGHWDITAKAHPGEGPAHEHVNGPGTTSQRDGDRERAFRIRGEPGDVVVYDERWNPHKKRGGDPLQFRSVIGAMLWIMEELMQEPKQDDIPAA